MHTARKLAMLEALGVVAYSRVRRVKAKLEPTFANEVRALVQTEAKAQKVADAVYIEDLRRQVTNTKPDAPTAPRAAVKLAIVNRAPSVRSELVLPSAEVERFSESRMYRHFCLLLAQGIAIPVVENAVLSDTALHFEQPPKSALKLGSMALLRSAWRAKRQAWLAIRLWRKQQAPN
jgi:hypothetical protein